MDTRSLDVDKIKKNVAEYWREESWNWPVKVISAERAAVLHASKGKVVLVSGYVTSEKFVRGRQLGEAERILGLMPGELKNGAVMLRLNMLPQAHQFDLRGYTQTPGGETYQGSGYPPGLGASQWELKVTLPATVITAVGAGQRL